MPFGHKLEEKKSSIKQGGVLKEKHEGGDFLIQQAEKTG